MDERKRWADLLWDVIGKVDRGQTNYWTAEQLRLVVREIEPPPWGKDLPINLETTNV